jgi:hypothetical protein
MWIIKYSKHLSIFPIICFQINILTLDGSSLVHREQTFQETPFGKNLTIKVAVYGKQTRPLVESNKQGVFVSRLARLVNCSGF